MEYARIACGNSIPNIARKNERSAISPSAFRGARQVNGDFGKWTESARFGWQVSENPT